MKPDIRIVSYAQAEEEDFAEWLAKTPEERLDTLQYLRELVYDLNHEDRKRFQHVVHIVKWGDGQ
jgi:predicted solute-binding protein